MATFKEEKLRRLTFAEINDMEAEVDNLIINTQTQLHGEIIKHYNNPDYFYAVIPLILGSFMVSYRSILYTHNYQITQYTINHINDTFGVLLSYNGLLEEHTALLRTQNNTLDKFNMSFFSRKSFKDGKSIDQRIKTIISGAEKTVRNIAEVGVKNGLSAEDIAKQIDNFIRPDKRRVWKSPIEWVKERFANPSVKQLQIRGGSLDYNAIRIARTEGMNTLRDSYYQQLKGKPWIQGWNWILSARHKGTGCLCEYFTNGSPYTDKEIDNLKSHPNCMCRIEPIINMTYMGGLELSPELKGVLL